MYANNNMIFKLEKLFKRVYYYRLLFKNYIYILFNLKNKNKFYVKLKDGTSGEITRDLLIDLVNLAQWGLISDKDISFKNGKLYSKGNPIYATSRNRDLLLLSLVGWIIKDEIIEYPEFNVKFKLNCANSNLLETFNLEDYKLDVKEREVVDIGANIGDTAIYFSVKGAKHVYAYEPQPAFYKCALENIKLNNLENNITMINAAIGAYNGEFHGIDYITGSKFNVVKIPIKNVIKQVSDKYLLKIDCEGCEAELINDCDNFDFEYIIFEHHKAWTKIPVKRLIKKLETLQYKCTLKPAKFTNQPKSEFGVVMCHKNK